MLAKAVDQATSTSTGRQPSPCRSWLASEDGGRSDIAVTDRPLSRAGSLTHWQGARHTSPRHPQPLWERACSRRRRPIQHRSDRQTAFASRLAHIGKVLGTHLPDTRNPCGSGLAREGGGPFNIAVTDRQTAFASKPAPTLGRCQACKAPSIPVRACSRRWRHLHPSR
ncbi:hypothetical protein PS639_04592 [Pseudomonas fluorescens]|nr:hypothetical protein PS639_04592 [Pseudomonas fluorescens]